MALIYMQAMGELHTEDNFIMFTVAVRDIYWADPFNERWTVTCALFFRVASSFEQGSAKAPGSGKYGRAEINSR